MKMTLARIAAVIVASFSFPAAAQIEIFQDCAECPEMAALPPGQFVMGAPESESEGRRFGWGGPEVAVSIDQPFAMAVSEITRSQFKIFLDETGYELAPDCGTVWVAQVADEFGEKAVPTWQDPLYPGGVKPADDHPMVCVRWHDIQAYVAWLTEKVDGKRFYYIPSEAEWEYAARGGTTGPRPWGTSEVSCAFANIGDTTYRDIIGSETISCTDGIPFTAPVKSFPPNAFGLYDMLGNVWEWTHDCWHSDHSRATTTGAPLIRGGDCTKRVMRGAGFSSEEFYVRVTSRGADPVPETRLVLLGFRVAATVN